MNRILLLLCTLTAAPVALGAQAVVTPSAPLDAARTRVRDAMLMLRDSLMTVNGAAARLQRDFRQTSAASLTSRAREVANACDRSVRTIVPARKVIAEARPGTPVQLKTRTNLLRSLDVLDVEMAKCSSEFTAMAQPGKGEEVRGYANRRAEPVLKVLGDYDYAASGFFATWGIDVRPLGARPSPLAS